jgi:hypothetical protein
LRFLFFETKFGRKLSIMLHPIIVLILIVINTLFLILFFRKSNYIKNKHKEVILNLQSRLIAEKMKQERSNYSKNKVDTMEDVTKNMFVAIQLKLELLHGIAKNSNTN